MKPNLSSRDAMALYTIIEAIAERDNLRAQLAEREEDRALLDWLEAGLRQTDPKQQLVRIERGWKEPLLNVITYDGRTTRQHTADTLRAAIRAARTQPEDGK